MNKKNLICNIFFTIALLLIWGAILFATWLLWVLSDVFRLLGNGILVYVFISIYAFVIVLPIILRKRLSKYLPLPVSFIVFAVVSVMTVSLVYAGARAYISSFSQEKWHNNENLRFYMIDDLENKHQIIGKTQSEITELIGKPTYFYSNQEDVWEYFIGFSIIDGIGYQIEFENGIAENTKVVVH